jgi:deoxyribonuclease IV
MIRIGVHCSIRKSLSNSLDEAGRLGCNTMQIFTRSPMRWLRRDIGEEEIAEFRRRRLESGIEPLVIHIPYLPNLATSSAELFAKSGQIISEELEISEKLGADYVVFHPGAYSFGSDAEFGVSRIISSINSALDGRGTKVVLLLENVAGGGRRLGATFQELKRMIDGVKKKENIGVCLDTAHLIAAGYGLSSEKEVSGTVAELDRVLGISTVKVIHLNDSLFPRGSGRDRHQHIAKGYIGAAGFRAILRHKKLRQIPMILETPKDSKNADRKNLEMVKKLAGK